VSCRQVPLEIGIDPNMRTRWRGATDAGASQAIKGTGTPRDREVMRLKRELARVRQQRDFLIEAATDFARESP